MLYPSSEMWLRSNTVIAHLEKELAELRAANRELRADNKRLCDQLMAAMAPQALVTSAQVEVVRDTPKLPPPPGGDPLQPDEQARKPVRFHMGGGGRRPRPPARQPEIHSLAPEIEQ